ncbi:AVN_HP_G0103890.mRNA.1.CDS.1 [Saccharomyces cerevisiae]|nr:AVN_HP_G0130140.mRNA.1.CDS.1 [Saccharomyces cerevisiae]CAI4960005.1 AVN_HP_G0012850.mRNA.1.CDS.1 [Saccharomyces cerevisiae]CAI5007176.1 AVN_HP_G0049540.mRNA.1.CDS.1 [Saccharomyces cerevisiae]CAI5030389.1 AVN_HP_G0070560.mRNA.1.CDS.1 [Saccharomyces cerevisiae]CAI5121583.1 AVN_HP_G0103890.mRNA.1.CDS.1 [Saccharomyces cerevisiae]
MAHEVHRIKPKLGRTQIFWVFLAFRVLNAVLTRTFFQADEFWQALEPAHWKAFKYGELTWEWKFGVRSYLFPMIFELTYRLVSLSSILLHYALLLLSTIGSDLLILLLPKYELSWQVAEDLKRLPFDVTRSFEYYGVIYAPKIVMAVLASIGEYYIVRFVQKLYLLTLDKRNEKEEEERRSGLSEITKFALLLSLTNFFNCFFITRTFINSFEMILTSIALYYWDWTGGQMIKESSFTKSLIFAFLACLQRPSSGLIWVIPSISLILNLVGKKQYHLLFITFSKVLRSFFLVFTANAIIDTYFYEKVTFPFFRFLKFNFTTPLSKFYGVAPWHFHFFQSLPIVLGASIPAFAFGLFFPLSKRSSPKKYLNPFFQVKLTILLNLLVYSTLPHKEFRFIFPLQPLFILISSFGLLRLDRDYWKRLSGLKSLLWLVPFVSVFIALLLDTFHESGSIEVMKFLHEEPEIDSLGFIMPCHSTPGQSYLHRSDIQDLWSITCNPPLHLLGDPEAYSKLETYMDESDHLYDDISAFIYKNFPPPFRKDLRSPGKTYSHEWPTYLVVFEHMENAFLKDFLKDSSYIEYNRFFNSLAHWDSRRSGDIIIYYKSPFDYSDIPAANI